jgi:hypothetical protein
MKFDTGDARLVTQAQAAEYLCLSRSTLREQRMRKRRPSKIPLIPYIRVGRYVRYDIGDLDNWIASQRVVPS